MTKEKWTRIDKQKFKGINTLLNFAIKQYTKQTPNTSERQNWYECKERLAEIRRQQFYSESDKVFLNELRNLYYTLKWVDQHYVRTI